MNTELFMKARALIESVTPLKTDCGLLCESACCRDNGEAGSGVWLWPCEDETKMSWGETEASVMPVTGTPVRILKCSGPCDRTLRPFLCEIFPLTPYFSQKSGQWDVRMDRRAAAICPLFSYGKAGLRSEFVSACREAVRLLARDEEWEETLRMLNEEENAYRMKLE